MGEKQLDVGGWMSGWCLRMLDLMVVSLELEHSVDQFGGKESLVVFISVVTGRAAGDDYT